MEPRRINCYTFAVFELRKILVQIISREIFNCEGQGVSLCDLTHSSQTFTFTDVRVARAIVDAAEVQVHLESVGQGHVRSQGQEVDHVIGEFSLLSVYPYFRSSKSPV